MEISKNSHEYKNIHIENILSLLDTIPTKEQVRQKDQTELNTMTPEARRSSTQKRIEETTIRDLEPGIYNTRIELFKIAIITYSKDKIRQLLEYSSNLCDDILQYLFENSEELGGKDFRRNDEHREQYYQQFIDYIRPNQQSSYTSNISLLDTLIS